MKGSNNLRWLGVTIAAAACAPAATVASADVDLGSRGGITYVMDEDSPSPPDVSVMEAGCPAGNEASGGIADPGTNVDSSDLNDLAPADGVDGGSVPDDAWFASVRFPDSPFLPNPRVFAICEERSHVQAIDAIEISPGEGGSLAVPCPGRKRPTGGGVRLSGAEGDGGFVNSTFPYDDGDRGSVPDDGWKGRAFNPAGASKTMEVTAICRRGQLGYSRRHDRAGAGHEASASVGCRVEGPAHLVGVGWRWGGPTSESEFAFGDLNDSFDGDDVPDDYARLVGVNKDGARKKLTGYAICVR
jgi:hypothetical protein